MTIARINQTQPRFELINERSLISLPIPRLGLTSSTETTLTNQATSLNNSIALLKKNIKSILLLNITFSLLNIRNADEDIYNILNLDGNIIENLKSFLNPRINRLNFILLKLILPTLNFILEIVGTNFFLRLEHFLFQNIHEFSQNASKREALLSYLATKVDCLIHYQKTTTPLTALQDSFNLLTSSYEPTSQNINSDYVIKELISNLSTTITSKIKPEFKFKYLESLNIKINQIHNKLQTLIIQPKNIKTITSIIVTSLHYLCLKILTIFLINPLNNVREILVDKVFYHLEPIANLIITKILNSLKTWLIEEKGLETKLQTIINASLIKSLESHNTRSEDYNITSTTDSPNISKKEEIIIQDVTETLTSLFFETTVTSELLEIIVETNIDLMAQNIIKSKKELFLKIINSKYKEAIKEDSIKSVLNSIINEVNLSIKTPSVPRDSANPTQPIGLINEKNREFQVLLSSKLNELKDDFIDQKSQDQSKKDKFISVLKKSFFSVANFTYKSVYQTEIIPSAVDNYIYPKFLGLKAKLIDPETTNTLILSTLPQINTFLSQMR